MTIRNHAVELIEQATGNRNVVLCPRLFIDMLDGDRNAATVLNQILYWSDRTQDPTGWFYKTYDDWYDELGLSEYQVRRVVWGDSRVQNPKKTLRDVGIEVQVKRAPNGSPVVHYRIDKAIFFAVLTDYLERRYKFEPRPPATPTAQSPMVDNVQDGNFTTSGMENEQCEGSSYTEITPDREIDILAEKKAALKTAQKAANSPLAPNPDQDPITGDNSPENGRKAAGTISKRVQTPWETSIGSAVKNSPHTVQDAWNMTANQMELQLDPNSFDTYLRRAVLVDFEPTENCFVIQATNTHTRDMLTHRLSRHIQQVLSAVYGKSVRLRFVLPEISPKRPVFGEMAHTAAHVGSASSW